MTVPWEAISPEVVLNYREPTNGFLCPWRANIYNVDFLRFEIKDYDTGRVVYQVSTEPGGLESLLNDPNSEIEKIIRSVKYTFPASFLTFKTVRTSLEFCVGSKPINSFRMIERHYFKNQLVRSYDFTFGFCIPNAINAWEAIYDVPHYSKKEIEEYVSMPFAHQSDSFYFADDLLIMHNKAEYQYVMC